MIAILDYELGNIQNIKNALTHLGYEAVHTRDEEVMKDASHIILPGVGHYKDAMNALERFNLIERLNQFKDSKPIIGICLGMQLLYEHSEEGHTDGLGFVQGTIRRMETPLPVPHLGWNNLISDHPLLDADVYFIHSYQAPMDDKVVAYAQYGTDIPGIIQQNNIIGIQFHPEKSGDYGLLILKQALNGGFKNDRNMAGN